jgi:hypothetical protein
MRRVLFAQGCRVRCCYVVVEQITRVVVETLLMGRSGKKSWRKSKAPRDLCATAVEKEGRRSFALVTASRQEGAPASAGEGKRIAWSRDDLLGLDASILHHLACFYIVE